MPPKNSNPAKDHPFAVQRHSRCTVIAIISASIILPIFFFLIQNHTTAVVRDLVTNALARGQQTLCQVPPPSEPVFDRTYTVRSIPELEDLDSNDAWKKMLNTPQGGFLWVKYNETKNIAWGVSMFHAIHCLTLLRGEVQRTRPGGSNATAHGGHEFHDQQSAGHHAFDPTHVGHCFSYIAQHILCQADDTIEPPWTVKDDKGQLVDGGVDGEGYKHKCRDASLIWDTVTRAEHEAVSPWGWKQGDTVHSVFGKDAREGY